MRRFFLNGTGGRAPGHRPPRRAADAAADAAAAGSVQAPQAGLIRASSTSGPVFLLPLLLVFLVPKQINKFYTSLYFFFVYLLLIIKE